MGNYKMKNKPFKTIEYKTDWQDYIQWFDYYNCNINNGVIFVIDYYAPREILEKIEKFMEAIERNSDIYFYQSWDNIIVDHEDNCAYDVPYYDSGDYIMLDSEIIGKRRIEEGIIEFEDFQDEFINNPDRALPSWVKIPEGWEECSCDYASGWYHRNDDPKEILEKANEKGYDVIFKINYSHMFETGFCVYYKEKEL